MNATDRFENSDDFKSQQFWTRNVRCHRGETLYHCASARVGVREPRDRCVRFVVQTVGPSRDLEFRNRKLANPGDSLGALKMVLRNSSVTFGRSRRREHPFVLHIKLWRLVLQLIQCETER